MYKYSKTSTNGKMCNGYIYIYQGLLYHRTCKPDFQVCTSCDIIVLDIYIYKHECMEENNIIFLLLNIN